MAGCLETGGIVGIPCPDNLLDEARPVLFHREVRHDIRVECWKACLVQGEFTEYDLGDLEAFESPGGGHVVASVPLTELLQGVFESGLRHGGGLRRLDKVGPQILAPAHLQVSVEVE